MEKFTTKKLWNWEIAIFHIWDITLHAYKTNDPLEDESFILEKWKNLVAIELPSFHENLREFKEYVKWLNKPLSNIFVSYHPSWWAYFEWSTIYWTKSSEIASKTGHAKQLNEEFVKMFWEILGGFDSRMTKFTKIIEAWKINVWWIDFNIIPNQEWFDIEIPEINAIYTHMLGKNVHSIIPSKEYMDYLINILEWYKKINYKFILTSHHTPEDIEAVREKIIYVKKVKEIASQAETKEEFTKKVKKIFNNYRWENYLEMTAWMLYS